MSSSAGFHDCIRWIENEPSASLGADSGPPCLSNLCKICTSCLWVQLFFTVGVVDVPGDGGTIPPKQLRHLQPGQPDRLLVEAHVHTRLAAVRLVNGDFAAGEWLRHDCRAEKPRSSIIGSLTRLRRPEFLACLTRNELFRAYSACVMIISRARAHEVPFRFDRCANGG